MPKYCLYCFGPSEFACACCGIANYCCKACQKSDYHVHKHEIMPIQIKMNAASDIINNTMTRDEQQSINTNPIKNKEPVIKEEEPMKFSIKKRNLSIIQDLQNNIIQLEMAKEKKKGKPIKMNEKEKKKFNANFEKAFPPVQERKKNISNNYYKTLNIIINHFNGVVPPVNPSLTKVITLDDDVIREKISIFFRMNDVLFFKSAIAFMSTGGPQWVSEHENYKKKVDNWRMSIIHDLIFGDRISMNTIRQLQADTLKAERINQTRLHILGIVIDMTNKTYMATVSPEIIKMDGNGDDDGTAPKKRRGRPPKIRIVPLTEEQKTRIEESIDVVTESINLQSDFNNSPPENKGTCHFLSNSVKSYVNGDGATNDPVMSEAHDLFTEKTSIFGNINWFKWINIFISILLVVVGLISFFGVEIFSTSPKYNVASTQSEVDNLNASYAANLESITSFGTDLYNAGNVTLETVLSNQTHITNEMLKNYNDHSFIGITAGVTDNTRIDTTYNGLSLNNVATLFETTAQKLREEFIKKFGDDRGFSDSITKAAVDVKTYTDSILNDDGDRTRSEYALKQLLSYNWQTSLNTFLPQYEPIIQAYNTLISSIMRYRGVLLENIGNGMVELSAISDEYVKNITIMNNHTTALNNIKMEMPWYYELLSKFGQETILIDRKSTFLIDRGLGIGGTLLLNGANIIRRLQTLGASWDTGFWGALLLNTDSNAFDTFYYILAGLLTIELTGHALGLVGSIVDWIGSFFGENYRLPNMLENFLYKFNRYNDDAFTSNMDEQMEKWKEDYLVSKSALTFEQYLANLGILGKIDDPILYAKSLLVMDGTKGVGGIKYEPSHKEIYAKYWSNWYNSKRDTFLSLTTLFHGISLVSHLRKIETVSQAVLTTVALTTVLAVAQPDTNLTDTAVKKITDNIFTRIFPIIQPIVQPIVGVASAAFLKYILSMATTLDSLTRRGLKINGGLFIMGVASLGSKLLSNGAGLMVLEKLFDVASYMPGDLRNMTFINDVPEYLKIKENITEMSKYKEIAETPNYYNAIEQYKSFMLLVKDVVSNNHTYSLKPEYFTNATDELAKIFPNQGNVSL